jgi:hypothetical protein
VELPNTIATVEMPSEESSVSSWKIRPAGTNRSAWVGRSAPPDSTRFTTGSRLTRAISSARSVLRSEYGFIVPPRTVGSWPITTHSTPDTTPIPVSTDAPTVNSVPHAASAESSRNGLSGSSSSSTRSRTGSFPRSRWRATLRSPPPAITCSSCASRRASRPSWAARLLA